MTYKFKVGDSVIVTAGKDKGKSGKIVKVIPEAEKVVVDGVNLYVRHIRPMAGRAGEKVTLARPLATAKIAVLNDQNQPDRVGYEVAKDGTKIRVFRKTGTPIPVPTDSEVVAKPKADTKTKRTAKKTK
jgi:large subunit ribosomal protein L24